MTTTNSNLIGNAVASPVVHTPVGKQYGRVRISQDSFEVTGTLFDADNDIIRLARIPVNARIISIKIGNDDLDSGSDSVFNLGVQRPDGTIEDEDFFASLVTQLQADARLTDLYDEAALAANRDEVGETLWEMLDVASDPGGSYDICMYQTAAVSSPITATVNFQILYSVD